jgi:hypothetical protein
MRLDASIVARELLPETTRDAMLALHMRNFENVHRERFLTDLAEKDWVILLTEPNGDLVGFSTQKLMQPVPGFDSVRCLFSGDTVVDRAHWNTPLLAGCFGHLMLRLLEQHRGDSLFWFLISKGFRTYRFLPVFFNQFWPSPNYHTPPAMETLLSGAAKQKFGNSFDVKSGLVRIPETDCLMPELAKVPEGKRADSYVAYFLARNPGFSRGDELACLAPISVDNLNAYAHRVIRATQPTWRC